MLKLSLLSLLFLAISSNIAAQKGFGFNYDSDLPTVLKVTGIHKNSSAEKAGLQVNDLILAINGDEKVQTCSIEEFKKIMAKTPDVGNIFLISRNNKVSKLPIDKGNVADFAYHLVSTDKSSGQCVVEYMQILKIKGNCQDGKINGPGKIFNKEEKLVFEGLFENNIREGAGIEYLKNQRYEGNFAKDARDGKGKIFLGDGNYVDSKWSNGLADGYFIYYGKNHIPTKFEHYENGKLIPETFATAAKETPKKSNSGKAYEIVLEKINEMLADNTFFDQSLRIEDEYLIHDTGNGENQINIRDLGKIEIDKKYNLATIACKNGNQCVASEDGTLDKLSFRLIIGEDKLATLLQQFIDAYKNR